MKIALVILTLLASGFANAHSQTPSDFGGAKAPLDAITITGVVEVPITVGNLNKYVQSYEITVDGKVAGKVTIGSRLFRKLQVPVKLHKPNTPETHEVCSVSAAGEGAMFRTRICTKAQLYWLDRSSK